MTRGDWQNRTKRQQRAAMTALAAIYGRDREHRERVIAALADHPALADTPRAKPVQHEHAAGRELMARARREWWGRYLRHHEQASAAGREGTRRRQAGQARGFPDYTLIVPKWRHEEGIGLLPILAALELKAESRRPKRDPGLDWWLAWGEEMDATREAWELRPNAPTRYGLGAEQAITLWELAGAGFATKVAYGAEEAFAWLGEVAGG